MGMMMRPYKGACKKFIFFMMLTVYSAPVRAADAPVLGALAPLNFQAVYSFGLGSMTFGKVGVDIAQKSTGYDMTTDIMSTGIVNMFVQHTSHSVVSAKGKHFPYALVNYETNYQTKKKKKHVTMTYKDGVVTQEEALPPDNRDTRPAVTKAMKDVSVDPLSFIIAMRQKVYEAYQGHKDGFTLYVYDGRRLTQVNFVIVGDTNVAFDKTKAEVVQVDVSRKQIEGFTASEIADARKKDPPLHVYFTRDERMIPILFEAPMWLGTARASLLKECAKGESCLFGITG